MDPSQGRNGPPARPPPQPGVAASPFPSFSPPPLPPVPLGSFDTQPGGSPSLPAFAASLSPTSTHSTTGRLIGQPRVGAETFSLNRNLCSTSSSSSSTSNSSSSTSNSSSSSSSSSSSTPASSSASAFASISPPGGLPSVLSSAPAPLWLSGGSQDPQGGEKNAFAENGWADSGVVLPGDESSSTSSTSQSPDASPRQTLSYPSAPLWASCEAVDWALSLPFSLPFSVLPTSTQTLLGYPRSLRFVARLLRLLVPFPNSFEPFHSKKRCPRGAFSALVEEVRQTLSPKLAGGLLYVQRTLDTVDDALWTKLQHLLHKPNDVHAFHGLLLDIISRVKSLAPGATAIFPGGVCLDADSRPTFLLFLVHRLHRSTSSSSFSAPYGEGASGYASASYAFAVINASGCGSEFHAYRLEQYPSPGAVQRDLLLVLEDVNADHVVHSSFWFAVYRLLLSPSPTNFHVLYTVLLPHLNGKPLLHNWLVSPSSPSPDSSFVCLASSSSSSWGSTVLSSVAAAVGGGARANGTKGEETSKEGKDVDLSSAALVKPAKLGGCWRPAPQLRTAGSSIQGAQAVFVFLLRCFGLSEEEATSGEVVLHLAFALLLLEDLSRLPTLVGASSSPDAELLPALGRWLRTRQGAAQAAASSSLGFSFDRSQALLVSFAIQNLGRLASEQAWQRAFFASRASLLAPQFRCIYTALLRLKGEMNGRLSLAARGFGAGGCTLQPAACTPEIRFPGAAVFPHFGSFRLDGAATDEEAGQAAALPFPLPVDLSSAAERVETIDGVLRALRKAVVPLPLPHTDPLVSQSLWHAAALRRDTQIELLRLLHALARHFAATFFSLPNSRSMDAERLTTMAAVCCLADCILRLPACDEPSTVSLFYSGLADGPVQPFVFDISGFAEESSFLLLYDPVYATARTQILDYFSALRREVPWSHVMFAWEKGLHLGEGDRLFLEHVAVSWAFPRQRPSVELYMSGEKSDIADLFPEFVYLRDLVFMFKALMTPAANALPDLRRWSVADATLRWRFDPTEERFSVTAFQKQLNCSFFGTENDYYEKVRSQKGAVYRQSVFQRLAQWLGVGEKPRAPPSGADPSTLLPASALAAGDRITTEEDVLYIKKLPTFNASLRPQDCELLLQYLTAPYLRIPLVTQFFAEEGRADALVLPQLQLVFSAVLFEPWHFQHEETKKAPDLVPPASRSYLATPLGLLFNELQHSPQTLLSSLGELLAIAIDRETGAYGGPSALLLLYVIRVVVRVQSYVLFILRHNRYWKEGWQGACVPSACEATRRRVTSSEYGDGGLGVEDESGGGEQSEKGEKRKAAGEREDRETPGASAALPMSRSGWAARVRGLPSLSKETLATLRSWQEKLEARLRGEVLHLLETWAYKAVADSDIRAACRLYAHIALLYQNCVWEELNAHSVSALLVSLFFIFSHHKFALELPMSAAFTDSGGALGAGASPSPTSGAGAAGAPFLGIVSPSAGISGGSLSGFGSKTPVATNSATAAAMGAKRGPPTASGGVGSLGDSAGDSGAGPVLGGGASGTDGADDVDSLLGGDPLGLSDMAVFQMLQQHRLQLLRWLESHQGDQGANEVLEAVVRTATFTGKRAWRDENFLSLICGKRGEETTRETADSVDLLELDGEKTGRGGKARQETVVSLLSQGGPGDSSPRGPLGEGRRRGEDDALVARDWREVGDRAAAGGLGGRGRFAPATHGEADRQERHLSELESGDDDRTKNAFGATETVVSRLKRFVGREKGGEKTQTGGSGLERYERWLRKQIDVPGDTEINLQLAEFTLKRNQMEMLGEWANDFVDFTDLFGLVSREGSFQCALVANTTERLWCRLVGRRYDLQRWEPPSSDAFLSRDGPFASLFEDFTRVYSPFSSSSLADEETWVPAVLDPWLARGLLPPASVLLLPRMKPTRYIAVASNFFTSGAQTLKNMLGTEKAQSADPANRAGDAQETCEAESEAAEGGGGDRQAETGAEASRGEEHKTEGETVQPATVRLLCLCPLDVLTPGTGHVGSSRADGAKGRDTEAFRDGEAASGESGSAFSANVSILPLIAHYHPLDIQDVALLAAKDDDSPSASGDGVAAALLSGAAATISELSGVGSGSSAASSSSPPPPTVRVLKEIIVQRDPPLVLVFNLVEQGRKLFRELCYASDARHSFDSVPFKRLDEVGFSSPCSPSPCPPSSAVLCSPSPVLCTGVPAAFPRSGWRGPVSFFSAKDGAPKQETADRGKDKVGKTRSELRAAWPTLVVARNLDAGTDQEVYVPTRFLRGLVPFALLEDYEFWQRLSDGRICGSSRPRSASRATSAVVARSAIHIHLVHTQTRGKCVELSDASAIVQRVAIKTPKRGPGGLASSLASLSSSTLASASVCSSTPSVASAASARRGEAERDGEDEVRRRDGGACGEEDDPPEVHTLFNLQLIDKACPLFDVVESLKRVEELSHILVWSTGGGIQPKGPTDLASLRQPLTLDLIELPRLGLTFRAQRPPVRPSSQAKSAAVSLCTKYMCEQHSGLFLSTGEILKSPLTARLIQGLPPSLLLSNEEGDLFLLLAATAKPYRVFRKSCLAATLAMSPPAREEGPFSGDRPGGLYSPTATAVDARRNEERQKDRGVANQLAAGSSAVGQAVAAFMRGGKDEREEIEKGNIHSAHELLDLLEPSVVFDYSDPRWLCSLRGSRHYVYPIHSSRSFLFIPTAAAGLYLLLLRYLARQYGEVCQLVETIVFAEDAEKTSLEEQQIWALIGQLQIYSRDFHPDAHACRIKIWLAAYRQGLTGSVALGGKADGALQGVSSFASLPRGAQTPPGEGGDSGRDSRDSRKRSGKKVASKSAPSALAPAGLLSAGRDHDSSAGGSGRRSAPPPSRSRLPDKKRKGKLAWLPAFSSGRKSTLGIASRLLDGDTAPLASGLGDARSAAGPQNEGPGGGSSRSAGLEFSSASQFRSFFASWDIFQDLLLYVRKVSFVSAACRLALEEELELLRLCPAHLQALPEVGNRITVLAAMLEGKSPKPRAVSSPPTGPKASLEPKPRSRDPGGVDASKVDLSSSLSLSDPRLVTISGLAVPAVPHIDDFDAVEDAGCLASEDSSLSTFLDACANFVSNFAVRRADQEDALQGPEALTFVGKLLDNGLRVSDFLLLYELLTNAFPLRVFSGEAPHLWGALLTRYLPSWDVKSKNKSVAILRVLMANPGLAASFPHLQESDKKSRLPSLGLVFRTQEPFQKLLKEIQQTLTDLSRGGRLRQPPVLPPGLTRRISNAVEAWTADAWQNRAALALRVFDYSCESRALFPVDGKKYSGVFSVFVEQQKVLQVPGAADARRGEERRADERSGVCRKDESRGGDLAPDGPGTRRQETGDTRDGRKGAAEEARDSLSVEELQLTKQAIEAFALQPLAGIGLSNFVAWAREETQETVGDREGKAADALPFVLDHHPAAQTRIGQATLQRLRHEVRTYEEQVSRRLQPILKGFSRAEVGAMLRSSSALAKVVAFLSSLRQRLFQAFLADGRFVDRSIRLTSAICNSLPDFDPALVPEKRAKTDKREEQEKKDEGKTREETDFAGSAEPPTTSFEALLSQESRAVVSGCLTEKNEKKQTRLVSQWLAAEEARRSQKGSSKAKDKQKTLTQLEWAFTLGKLAGTELTLSFDFLVSLMMSRDAEQYLLKLNPFLDPEMLQDVFSLVGGVLLAVNRRAQVCRCLREVVSLMRLLKQHSTALHAPVSSDKEKPHGRLSNLLPRAFHRETSANRAAVSGAPGGRDSAVVPQGSNEDCEKDPSRSERTEEREDLEQAILAIRMRAVNCAEQLAAKRHSMELPNSHPSSSSSPSPPSPPHSASLASSSVVMASYDPRYLVFEFAYNLLLRASQVTLLSQFRKHVAEGRSLCHQMIMGAGKTTVISPLLALLLADGSRLVAEVVPLNLLEFTRSVLRERFSAVIRKGVHTFHFSRYDHASQRIYLKLLQAKETGAIVLFDPTTLKSFFLKAIHLLHTLDLAYRAREYVEEVARLSEIEKAVLAGRSQLQKLQSNFAKLLGFQKSGTELRTRGQWV
ncbi:EF hand domain-containing protein [Toxoplasma gondii TgCatPRC2]|uniref:ubiquitinyl hydrolase 1 n=1 Tax=Toxoplasma gondii TgCatPRC2 TaxID=1130821 RepID=A0A151H8G6_TOXGO|nr:EF hand domain-containing protein [Toxoplasma gondii TgCatPRC2]